MKTQAHQIAEVAARLAVCWVLTVSVPHASAQPRADEPSANVPATWEFDFDLFQTLLETQGLESRNDESDQIRQGRWNRMFAAPSKSVMVLTGNIKRASNWRTFHTFLSQGGVILVASNEPINVHGFFRIDFGPVNARDHDVIWQGYEDCVQVTRIDSKDAIMQGVSTIVTNRSGWIGRLQGSLDYDWSPLAHMPRRLRPTASIDQPLVAIARGRNNINGRLIVIADGSPLSNGMLWHGNNLNLLMNLVRELTRDDRNAYAFLNDGQPVESRVTRLMTQEALRNLSDPASISPDALSDLSTEALAELPPEALADLPVEALFEIGNTLITSVEDSGMLDDLLTDPARNVADRFYRRGIFLTVCTIAMAVFLARNFLSGDAALPWLRKGSPPEPPDSPASQSMLAYNQAAGALSRDTCRHLTGSRESKDWKAQLQPNGFLWRKLYARSPAPQSTADAIAVVLSWSTELTSAQLSKSDFERLGDDIHQLKQLHLPPDPAGATLAWT